MINRGAILLRYREPMVRWINEADPCNDAPGITRESLQQERTIYLVSDDDMDGEAAVARWIEANFDVLFESELEGWYTDPGLWPKKRTLELFREWFEVEYHSVVVDTVGGAIHDDEC
ncbi:MAG: hypothetical protein WD356_02315 [Pseudomonadales bacterium]